MTLNFKGGVSTIRGEEKVFLVGLVLAILIIFGLLERYGLVDDVGRWITNLWIFDD